MGVSVRSCDLIRNMSVDGSGTGDSERRTDVTLLSRSANQLEDGWLCGFCPHLVPIVACSPAALALFRIDPEPESHGALRSPAKPAQTRD